MSNVQYIARGHTVNKELCSWPASWPWVCTKTETVLPVLDRSWELPEAHGAWGSRWREVQRRDGDSTSARKSKVKWGNFCTKETDKDKSNAQLWRSELAGLSLHTSPARCRAGRLPQMPMPCHLDGESWEALGTKQPGRMAPSRANLTAKVFTEIWFSLVAVMNWVTASPWGMKRPRGSLEWSSLVRWELFTQEQLVILKKSLQATVAYPNWDKP